MQNSKSEATFFILPNTTRKHWFLERPPREPEVLLLLITNSGTNLYGRGWHTMLFLAGLNQNSQTMFYRLLIGAAEKKDFVVFKNHKINLKSGDTPG